MSLKHFGDWSIVYEKAIRDDGTLYFPKRLNKEFLDKVRRTMGSYIFANQYQNEVIPEDDKRFRKEWFKYFIEVPKPVHRFAFCDPAISTEHNADFTALVVVAIDHEGKWYIEAANRYKYTPTEIIDLLFRAHAQFNLSGIGIEDVAFQKALLYMVHNEMAKRNVILPVHGVKPDHEKSKNARILGLVPRFEWGMIHLAPNLFDLESELLQFPRGAHDDLVDALAYIERISFRPEKERVNYENIQPNHPDYEKYYIQSLAKRRNEESGDGY